MKYFSFTLAAAFGYISAYGFAPYPWYLVTILCLSGLFMLWRRFPRKTVWLTLLYSWVYFLHGVGWLYVSLHNFGGMPSWLTGLVIGLFALFLALFPTTTAWLFQRNWIHSSYSLAAAWVIQEWVRGIIFTGFPWLDIGYSQAPLSPLVGFAPVVGVYGLSLVCVLTSSLAAFPTRKNIFLVIVLWVLGWFLHFIPWTHPNSAPLQVSLLQGNINQAQKWQSSTLSSTLHVYQDMVFASHAQLTVLPETAFPVFFDTIPPAYLDALSAHARAQHGDLLIGIPEELRDGQYFNSVMSFGTSPTQVYRKYHLVPFGEYIPLKPVFGRILDVLQMPLSDFSRGHAYQAPLRVANHSIAADICYEDVFGGEIIHPLPQADILVNFTDDAWFGNTAAPWQHLQIAQMRALETGRTMLRATNTGVTAIIEKNGVVSAYLPEFTRGTLNGTAQAYRGSTPFDRWGNYAALSLVWLLLLGEGLWLNLRSGK